MNNAELIKALRHCGKGGDVAERCLPCGYYDSEPWCEAALVNDAAAAIERLTAEVDRKDKTIERMRDLMKHYKAAYRTAYKLYQEARNEQQP